MANKSYVEVAYEVLSEVYDSTSVADRKKKVRKDKNGNERTECKYALSFGDLAGQVFERLGITDLKSLQELAPKFYTALTLDGRFVLLSDNTWVLREHELFETAHIDMNEVYTAFDPDAEDSDSEEKADEGDVEKEEADLEDSEKEDDEEEESEFTDFDNSDEEGNN